LIRDASGRWLICGGSDLTRPNLELTFAIDSWFVLAGYLNVAFTTSGRFVVT